MLCTAKKRTTSEREEEQSCYNDNIAPPPPLLLPEQDLFWEEEELTSLLSKERENQFHSKLEENPSLVGLRREAVEWVLKANAHYSFSALTAVLAVNYLDRFLFSVHFQREKPWMTQLAAVACLSLAAKVEETEVPFLLDLQVYSKFMCYLPSVLATATMLHIINGVDPCLALDYQTQVLGTIGINKAKVEDCYKLILDTTPPGFLGHQSNKRKIGPIPGSPNGVVVDFCFSSDSSNDSWAVAAAAEVGLVSSSPEPLSKRSKTH
ncbi:similar to CYCLIN D3;2 [Actinidia rufa]|uniref:Similar to CYCLIN D32 n=1 Tax=Actinidia rufa TaxID=165716 RepID=A0A7J0GHC5_9ERIC|nr:similar to CYCLIN D3;2 [Actinidia rufa]